MQYGQAVEWNILDQVPAMIWVADREQRVTRSNHQLAAFLGGNGGVGGHWNHSVHPEDDAAVRGLVERRIADGAACAIEVRLRGGDGTWRWTQLRIQPLREADGSVVGLLGLVIDISAARRQQERLVHKMTHDHLTGLPARAALERAMARQIETATDRFSLPVLVFGFDRFQSVNEAFGQVAGDAVLGELGARLIEWNDALAIGYMSGNRFVAIGETTKQPEAAALLTEQILALATEPFTIENSAHALTLSVGVATYPDDGETPEALLSAAETALQAAKRSGGSGSVFANPEQQILTKERFDLERELRFAIDHGQLRLHYQPKVAMRSRRLVGFEALIRWQHPERGLLAPDMFLPLAESANLLRPITAWAFEAAGLQTREWIDQGLRAVPIAVNATPDEFLNALLTHHLPAYQAHSLPIGLLEVEITESAMIQGFREVSAIVDALRPHGIPVAIDDFGTGYASLSGLKELPVATLKIDRAFTEDLQHDASSRAVAACIISIARELGLTVVAEGVETEAQLRVLAGLRCNIVQGYLTGRPVPADEAARLLQPAARRLQSRLARRPRVALLPA